MRRLGKKERQGALVIGPGCAEKTPAVIRPCQVQEDMLEFPLAFKNGWS